ncbi:MAG: RsmD family RNA methyltransferase [Planctomycetota bacterium]|jgi:16S rRNA (guanine(966)-N(2))-methyltransferase RsmD
MRIIAGQYKGRKLLPPPKGGRTRPITGAAKKSLFSILKPRLAGAVVADLYCGTGTLGLEALSCGAARVYFAERDKSAIERLRRNIAAVGAEDNCAVWPGDVERRLAGWLASLKEPLDVCFVDPPYARPRAWPWDAVARKIFSPLAGNLAADGIVVLRTDDKAEIPDSLGGLLKVRQKRYGSMVVVLLARPEPQ